MKETWKVRKLTSIHDQMLLMIVVVDEVLGVSEYCS